MNAEVYADKHAENKRLYAIDCSNWPSPWELWEFKGPSDLAWEECVGAPTFNAAVEFRRIADAPDFPVPATEIGLIPEGATSIDSALPDTGRHYRFMHNGINIDPAWIEKVCGPMTGMQFTILKKAIRMGTAHKDKRQDLLDIIGAAQRELELME